MTRNPKDPRLPSRPDDETTRELTGFDAPPSEARIGSAGNGASPHGADLTGGWKELEDEPHPDDILPDQLGKFAGAPSEEEEHLTARPKEGLEVEEREHQASPEDERPDFSTADSELP